MNIEEILKEPNTNTQTDQLNRTLNELNDKLIEQMKAAAGNTFPKIEQKPNKPWITQETLGLTQQAKTARDLDEWHLEQQLEKDIKKQARKDRTKWLHDSLRNSQNPEHELYDATGKRL